MTDRTSSTALQTSPAEHWRVELFARNLIARPTIRYASGVQASFVAFHSHMPIPGFSTLAASVVALVVGLLVTGLIGQRADGAVLLFTVGVVNASSWMSTEQVFQATAVAVILAISATFSVMRRYLMNHPLLSVAVTPSNPSKEK